MRGGSSDGSMAGLIRKALELRAPLAAETDAFRVVDGAADGIPGCEIDAFGDRWLVQTRGQPPSDEFCAALLAAGARSVYWKRLDQSEKSAPEHLAGSPVDGLFEVREHGLRFGIDFAAGYSQGLFLDQRSNRALLGKWLAGRPGGTVANCFAYTCSFGVVAAAAGADTVNIDLSRRTLEWGRENYRRNGLDPQTHAFLAGDVFETLARFGRRDRRFRAVVLDPPTFSRDRKGRVFRVERDLGELVRLAVAVLEPAGVLLVSSNMRALAPHAFRREVRAGAGPGARLRDLSMPPDFRGEAYLKAAWVER